MWRTLVQFAVASGPSLVFAPLAMAATAPASEFYAGNSVRLVIGATPGSGYDLYARLLARHMSRHIPGAPAFVVQNMDGAGGLIQANHLYNIAGKDGATIGALNRTVFMEPLFGNKQAIFDPSKFNWLGSMNKETVVCVSWHDSGITTFRDVLEREFTVGAVTYSDNTGIDPRILNAVLGTKMRVVTGYNGTNAIKLAIERGEVQGRCSWAWESLVTTSEDWLKQKKINVLLQMSTPAHRDLPTVPSSMDLAATEEQRQILTLNSAPDTLGRPFAAPPGVPVERVGALRAAFDAATKDPGLLAEAAKAKLKIDSLGGDDVQKLIERIYATPPSVVKAYINARQ